MKYYDFEDPNHSEADRRDTRRALLVAIGAALIVGLASAAVVAGALMNG